MNNLSDIKRRIASVKQTRQITGAMETISVAKMRKSFELYDEGREYFEVLESVVSEVLSDDSPEIAQLIAPPDKGRNAFIVITSDKGLCGGFNHDLLRFSDERIDNDCIVYPIGLVGAQHYSDRVLTDDSFVDFSSKPDYEIARKVGEAIIRGYKTDIRSVSVIYSKVVTHSYSKPQELKLLPFVKKQTEKSAKAIREFDPSPAAVLEKLLPIYLSGCIYGALINSSAAEHAARHAAMSASTKNADEMAEALSVEYNRARQSAVTEQITEMIGSTRVLSNQEGV